MRLGVLDVGSNTVHLLVVDAYPGARPLPAFSHKAELKLADQLDNGSSLSRPGERSLRDVVVEALLDVAQRIVDRVQDDPDDGGRLAEGGTDGRGQPGARSRG